MALNVCFRSGHVILCSYDVTVFSLFLATFRNGSKQKIRPLNLVNLKSSKKALSFALQLQLITKSFSCQRKLNTYNCFLGRAQKKKKIGVHLTCSFSFLKILPPGIFPNWNPNGKIFNLLPFNAWNVMPRRKRKKIQERGTHIFLHEKNANPEPLNRACLLGQFLFI